VDKNNCYQNACDYMIFNRKATLVHAIVTGQKAIEGIRYGHAWIEENGEAYDPGLQLHIPAELYRQIGQASDIKEYSYLEMKQQIDIHKHFGPWDDVISGAIHLKDLSDDEKERLHQN